MNSFAKIIFMRLSLLLLLAVPVLSCCQKVKINSTGQTVTINGVGTGVAISVPVRAQPYLNFQNAIIVADGNSITWGSPTGTSAAYPAILAVDTFFSNRSVTFYNEALGGHKWSDMQADAVSTIDSKYSGSVLSVCIAWEGTNQLYYSGASVSDAYNRAVDYCTARRAVGFKVIVATMPHAEPAADPTPNGQSTAQYIAWSQEYNAKIRAYWPYFADGFIDFEADSRFDNYDATYYQTDKVHLKTAGNTAMAELVKAALFTLH